MTNRTKNDVRIFNKTIDKCTSPVWLVSSEGKYYNMNSASKHDETMAEWINDTNDEMKIYASIYEDEVVMMVFGKQLHAA